MASPGAGKRKGLPSWLRVVSPATNLGSLKRGGKIKRTGNYRLHAGEEVIPARRVRKGRHATDRKARR
jgi:hypothetical protein